METTEKKRSDSEEQAWAQLSGICEMVAKLTKEGATKEFASGVNRENLIKILERAELIHPLVESGYEQDDEELREMLIDGMLNGTIDDVGPLNFEWDEDEAREAIQEDPLSVQVRGGWYNPGEDKPDPEEFEILLCTGGPAVRIMGELDEHNEPRRAWLEHQDWGTPWTNIFGLDEDQQEAVLTYCRQFYFGE